MASANTSKFDLFLFVTDTGDEFWLEMEYSTDLFDQDRISQCFPTISHCWKQSPPIQAQT